MTARTGDPNSTTTETVVPVPETKVDKPVESDTVDSSSTQDANNILKMIRSRQTAE